MLRQLSKVNFGIVGRSMLRGYSSALEEGSREHIQSLVAGKKLVVFMKGTPQNPRCGFSNAVIQVLGLHGINEKEVIAHDVLENERIRQGVKDFTNWPTIPQVFINGEFIGGCDIMIEMHQNGELIKELKKVDIISKFEK